MSLPWWWSHKLSSAKSENILVRWRGPQMNQLFFVSFVKVREAPSGWGHEATGLSETKKSFCNQGMRAWLTVRQSCNQLLLWEKKQFIFFCVTPLLFAYLSFFFLIIVYLSFTQQDSVMLLWTWHSLNAKIERYLWFLSQPFQSFGTICIFASRAGFSRTHYLHSICM